MKWLCAVALVLVLVSVVHGQSAREQLMSIADDFQNWRLKENPETATQRGLYEYNDRLSNFDFSRYPDYKSTVDSLYGRLMKITQSDLSRTDLTTYKMLTSHLRVWSDNYKWKNYKNLNPINFLEGPQKDVVRFPSNVPMNTRGDVENYLTRLQNWPAQIDQIKASLQESVRLGTANHNVSMNRLPATIEKLLNYTDVKTTNLYKPFKTSVEMDKINYMPQEKTDVINRTENLITAIFDSLRDLNSYIQNTYVPRVSIGVSSFTDGQEYYKAIIKWYLSLDLTPKQIHDQGLAEVERISNRMRKIMAKQGVSGTIQDYFASLLERPGFTYNTSEELLNGYRRQITEDIEPVLSKLFHKLPGLPLVVKPMESDGPTGTYDRGTPDGNKPGTFWANALRPEDIAKFGMMALTMHETNPGHHLQISIAMTSNMPGFRRSIVYDDYFEAPVGFPSFNAFSEGWALYAESLGEEVGLYKDDYELMGRYSSEIFRACRLVVDTGIHFFDWDRDRAINYIQNYTAMTRESIETEIDRYITWPGQALTYKIGELKIRELREKAKKKLGGNFDIRDFHRVVLENGRMPLNLIEQNVDYWLDNYVPPSSPTCAASHSFGTSHPLIILLCLPVFISRKFLA